MTNKLTIACLLVFVAGSIECRDQGSDTASKTAVGALAGAAAGATSAAATSNSNGNGNAGLNFADMDSVVKTFTDGQSALQGWMESFSGTKVKSGSSSEGKGEGGKGTDNIFNVSSPMEFIQLMMDPTKFMAGIATTFGLDKEKFSKAVARGMDFGVETMLQPPMECIKIIEKVFVPDACKLKFICDIGKQLTMFKGQMPKLPDSYFTGASSAKAMYDGTTGRECETVYACEQGDGPKLKSEYASLKQSSE